MKEVVIRLGEAHFEFDDACERMRQLKLDRDRDVEKFIKTHLRIHDRINEIKAYEANRKPLQLPQKKPEISRNHAKHQDK